jgi:hypothetical protein
MEDGVAPDIRAFAGSVGVVIDRSTATEEVLGTAWLLEKDRLATCAHLVAGYADHWDALVVRFPAIKSEEWGVANAVIHPRFDKRRGSRVLGTRGTIIDGQPVLPLMKHNAAVLTITPLKPLTDERKAEINKALTLPAPAGQGMSGNLSEIDLALIVQTINNARKEGVIVLSDARNRPIANLFCRGGKVVYAKYRNLINEHAFFQIFEHRLEGHFIFRSAREPDWEVDQQISRPTDMLLIEAHRRLDELGKMIPALGGEHSQFHRASEEINIGILPEDAREYAGRIWHLLDGATPINMFWQLVSVDDYLIFRALCELFKTRQIENVEEGGAFLTSEREIALHVSQSKLEPLAASELLQLVPLDPITSLTVDSETGRPRARDGNLLGALREGDPWHLVHNIDLLPEAAGSPVFKDGCVIGMHCGVLPPAVRSMQSAGRLQQMLWVESILECLKLGGEGELAIKLSAKGQESARASASFAKLPRPIATTADQSGCFEAAKVECKNCGASSLKSSRFCKTCGQRLLADVEPIVVGRRGSALAAMAAVLLLVFGASAFAFLSHMPKEPNLVRAQEAVMPDSPWLKFSVNRFDPSKGTWTAIRNGTMLSKSDHIYIAVKVHEPCHLYLLERQSTSNEATVIYPDKDAKDDQLADESDLTLPKEYQKLGPDGRPVEIGGYAFAGPAGTDVIVAMASRNPVELNSPQVVQAAFDAALPLLAHVDLPQGIEVNASSLHLSSANSSTNSPSSAAVSSPIYLARLPISHGD